MGDMAMALFSEIDDPKARYRLAQLHTAAGREARVNAEEFMQVRGVWEKPAPADLGSASGHKARSTAL